MKPASILVRVVFAVLLVSVPALLAWAAVPRFLFGLETEAAHRLVLSAIAGQSMPVESVRAAAAAFEQAPSGDGDDRAWAAEFLALAARGDPAVLAQSRREADDALADAPANPRAWTLFCALEADISPMRGVRCLDSGFAIARYDWYTADRRMQLIAAEWPFLDERLRDSAAGLILPMWNSAQWSNGMNLRGALFALSRSENGRQLLRAGLLSDREALRGFNRFVIEERIYGR